MALLPIIIAPDPRLKATCTTVEHVDDGMRRLMNNMLETMYDAPGIGLAAPQVGVTKRIIVVDVAREDEDPQPLRLVNPEITWESDDLFLYEEGCLSLPEQYAEVQRPARVRVTYVDHHDQPQTLEAEGLLATCIQHEMDHLEGVLFVDHVSTLKRSMIMRRQAKIKKQRQG